MLRICYTPYCQIFAIIKRNGGIIVDDFLSVLPAIIFWTAVVFIVKRVRREKAEACKRPQNDAQRGLVDDVIAAIARSAPDFDGANVYWAKKTSGSTGGIDFRSLSGYKYFYDFASRGYCVSQGMAYVLANEIAKHFGGECREYRDYQLECPVVKYYEVISPRQVAAEQQKKHRFDNLRQI